MAIVHQQHVLDETFDDFDVWCHDMTSNQFYAEDGLFSKSGTVMHAMKSEEKFYLEDATYLSLNAKDACVPEFETSTRSLSCSSMEEIPVLKMPQQHKDSWGTYFSKSMLLTSPSEDSVQHVPSTVPDVVDENETFQDLRELIEQEYSSPQNLGNELQPVLDVQASSSAVTSRSEDSQSSLIGSFSVGLSYESPTTSKKPVENRYKEMRRKNNIASKNARVARREKERQMEDRAKQLEEDNRALRVKVRRMEALAQELKTKLIQSVTRNK